MDVQLLAALVIGVALMIVLVLRTRLDAFVALLIAAITTGFIAGQGATDVITSVTEGFGNTLASIGIVIGLGVAVGKILEVSGAADSLARGFVNLAGRGRESWAMTGTGALVSIPVFCDSGYVIMNPLARSIARRRRRGYVTLALALGCGMTLTHHLVPPTPGPLAVAGILGADLGALVLAGSVFAVLLAPVVVLYARWIGPKLEDQVVDSVREQVYGRELVAAGTGGGGSATGGSGSGSDDPRSETSVNRVEGDAVESGDAEPDDEEQERDYDAESELGERPEGAEPHSVGAWLGAAPILVPLLLIVANTVGTAFDRNTQGVLSGDEGYEPSPVIAVLQFVGNPVVALIIGLVIAVYGLLPRWVTRKKVTGWLSDAAGSAGLIILITGAGGALGQVLRDSGVGDALAEAIASLSLPGVLVPFLIATLVRIAQGSGTVAMITSASITAPLLDGIGLPAVVAALGCCAGSMVFSYFNDSYFWVVTRFTGLEGTAALRGWSGITTAIWAGSLPLLLVANLVF